MLNISRLPNPKATPKTKSAKPDALVLSKAAHKKADPLSDSLARDGASRKRTHGCKTYEWQRSKDDAESVFDRDPSTFPWGYFSKEQEETYVGLFAWFESLDELLTYVAEIEPGVYLNGETDTAELNRMTVRLLDIRDRHLAGKRMSTSKLQTEIESILGDYLSFPWIGTFVDLCKGKGNFATDVIDEFFFDRDESDDTGKIAPQYFAEFIAFLRESASSLSYRGM